MAENTKPENSKDTIAVPKDTLQQILDGQKLQSIKIEEQAAEIKRLQSAASKKDLARYDDENKEGELIKHVNIRKWEGDIVLGWKKGKDNVGVVNGVLIEDQTVIIFVESGKKGEPKEIEIPYLSWAQNFKYETAEVIKEAKTKNAEIFTVQLEDGRNFDLDIKFVN